MTVIVRDLVVKGQNYKQKIMDASNTPEDPSLGKTVTSLQSLHVSHEVRHHSRSGVVFGMCGV